MNDKMEEKGKGILNGLNEINEMEEEQEKSKEEKNSKNKDTKDNEKKSKIAKKKRSFMLKEDQIERLYMMKAKDRNKNLSQLVGAAIDLYYEENF